MDKINVEFTDVEIQRLSTFLGNMSVRDIVDEKSDSPYLVRAIKKVFRADQDINGVRL